MKKKLFVILFAAVILFNLTGQDVINILITDFENISSNDEDDFIINHINDALKVKISNIKKFKPELFNEVLNKTKDQTPDNKTPYSFALKNNYDIIIKGFYYTENENIKISFTVVDVITDRIKISYSTDGKTGIQIISMINQAADILAKKMETEIEPYAEDIIQIEKRKRIKELISLDSSFLFTFETGFNFRPNISFGGSIQNEEDLKNITTYKDNQSRFNISSNFSPFFYWETKTKKSFIGFGFNFMIPFYVEDILVFSLFINPSIAVSYGLFKKFYFQWSFDLYFNNIRKFFSDYNDNESDVRINMLFFGTGFNFIYFPMDKIIGFSAGFNIYPPLGSSSEDLFYDEKKEERLNTVSIGFASNEMTNKESFFFPLTLNLGLFIFPNKKIGIS
ncbi:MAG: hypothetical protein JXB50_10565, partial [Spirochaetes bacterium]|nr:hypothetical protein [Spirochaetota bacterium]